ncbi:MAG: tetratricopeptide repeat protein, partial [candidate division Zixibacteria bacterium]|nr:tetratricopeptide repeat protein [candidate division Zixibacteria bacterium]
AIQAYQEINTSYPKSEASSQAFYQLGLIYQNQKEDLKSAKEFYAKAKEEKSGSEFANLALQKSADISKLEEYQTSLSSEETEESDKTRFLLAELYLTQMNKPESALAEYRSLVEASPNSEYTPKALLAMAWICHNHLGDTLGSKKICEEILEKYPNSDYAKPAKKFLNIQPEILTMDMPEILYLQAESLLLIHHQTDSALAIYHQITDQYPNTAWGAKALYATVWAKENYELAPDSEIALAYQEILDKYPDSRYAAVAETKLGKKKSNPVVPAVTDTSAAPKGDSIPPDSLAANPVLDIEQLKKQFPLPPLPKIKGPVIYPITLLDQKINGRVGMKIMIDFLGAVREAVVLYTSGYRDIDKA